MAVPSTHVRYGGGPGDFVGAGTSGGPLLLAGGALLSVWPSEVGGVQVRDLFNESQDAVELITADSFGNFEVYAPESYGTVYVSTDGGATRYPIQPSDIGRQVGILRERVANIPTDTGIPGDGGGGTGIPDVFVAASEADAANAPEGTLVLVRRDA